VAFGNYHLVIVVAFCRFLVFVNQQVVGLYFVVDLVVPRFYYLDYADYYFGFVFLLLFSIVLPLFIWFFINGKLF